MRAITTRRATVADAHQALDVVRRSITELCGAWGIVTLTLESTLTARSFYEHNGFTPAGDPISHFGILRGHPYTKTLSL